MYSTLDGDQPLSGRTRQYIPYERESPEPAPSKDVTLGIPALLGIFFAIVIVCGLAFGFGYSFGHRGPKSRPATSSAAPAPAVQTTAPMLQSTPTLQTTPMLQSPLESAARPVGSAPGPEVSGAAKPSPAAALALQRTASATGPESLSPAEHAALAAAAARPPTAVSGPSTATSGSQVMVQIAAVVRPADAEALASALRREGYNAQVRTDPNDRFLHVQVGPFPTRDAARSMRARLQANGYSPIFKP